MPQLRASHVRQPNASSYDLRDRSADPAILRRRAIQECLRELHGVELIYAIRCPDGTVKIGWTKNISERRRPLTTDHDAILAIRQGTYEDERAIHAQLAAHVAHGREYYHPAPEVLDLVNGMRAELGVPAIS